MASEASGHVQAEESGTTIEIKIRTMDSQTYSLQVDKQMPVPALKECIATVTGVVTDNQRLICRGKVLKDDQLLSAYHVEDGHTLHLVVREPTASSSENVPGDSASGHPSIANRGQVFQVAPGIVVEAFTVPGQGDRGFSDVGRLVSAVLGSMGIAPTEINSEMRDQAVDRHGSTTHTTQIPPAQSGMGGSNDSSRPSNPFGIPVGSVLAGTVQAPVIPDALATLSQYLSHLRQEFLGCGYVVDNNDGASSVRGNGGASSNSVQSENTLPSPASLAELLFATRQMLNQITEECLRQLARQLTDQANLTGAADRANAQSGALRSGILLQDLGAYFLELGRAITTLRLGRLPSEAVVNAGPAVFISPSGPNPLMVQALPFQPGASFGTPLTENFQSGPGLTNGLVVPRRIDIQIRRVAPSTHRTEPAGPQQSSGLRHAIPVVFGVARSVQPTTESSDPPSSNSGSGAPVLPERTMMTPAPDVHPPPPPGSLVFLDQLLGRDPNQASRRVRSRIESQLPADTRTPDTTTVQLNVGDAAGNHNQSENAAFTSSEQMDQIESVSTRTIEIDILPTGGAPSDMNDGQMPPSVLQFLRGLFPGGDLHVESVNSEIVPSEMTPPSGMVTEEAQPTVTEEGLFLSSILQQIMPLIPQGPETVHLGERDTSMQRDDATSSFPEEEEGSEARISRHREDDNPTHPDPKRRKME